MKKIFEIKTNQQSDFTVLLQKYATCYTLEL